MNTTSRFHDHGQTIYSFLDEILVVCPTCSMCACIIRREPDNHDWFAPRRLVCKHCGTTKEWAGRSIQHAWYGDPPLDSYFQLPLWLSTPFGDNILWAYNQRHLELIESFVEATLRERTKDPKYGWANRSLASRFPRWIGSAKNRQRILKVINHLKEKLPSCS